MIELKPAINEVKLTLKSISSPINLGTVMEPVSGGSVPTDVRQAIYTLLENAAYVTTGLEDEIAIVQAWAQEVTALSLSVTSLSLSDDTPQTIVATVVPAGSLVVWSSNNESVATVEDGVVTAVGNGSCVITATSGNRTANCAVTVSGFKELVSISAVYTQSGTVYDTDSLESLKNDLVVTATYDDSSTATVPSENYTLSGTLEVGTSTITVTYGGKTDTFTVTVSLPQGYTQYDFIKNAQTSMDCLIDTGLSGTYCADTYEHEMTFMFTNAASSTAYPFYGTRSTTGADPKSRVLWTQLEGGASKITLAYHDIYASAELPKFTFSTNTKYKSVHGGNSWYMNNELVSDQYTNEWTPYTGSHIMLFGMSQGSNQNPLKGGYTRQTMKLYGFKVTDLTTGEVIANMIPCKNSNNVAGLFDTVRRSFHKAFNTSSSYITAGND